MANTLNLKARALALSPERIYDTTSSTPAYPLEMHVADKVTEAKYLTRPADSTVLNCYTNNIRIAPQNLSNTALSGGSTVDNIIRKGSSQIADEMSLVLNVQNPTGTAVQAVPAPLLLDNFQPNVNDGRDPCSPLWGELLYILTCLYEPKEWLVRCGPMGLNEDWSVASTATVGATGGTQEWIVPLRGSLFNQIKCNIANIGGDIDLENNFMQPSMTGVTGPMNQLNLTGCDIILNNVNLDATDFYNKKTLYQNNSVKLRYLNHYRYNKIQSWSAGQYDIQLDNVQGMCSHMFFFLRPSPRTGANARSFAQIASFDLLDSDNTSILSYVQTDQFNRKHEWLERFPNSAFSLYNNVYLISFNLDPRSSYLTGQQLGYFPMNKSQTLRINLPAGFSAGNYELVVYSAMYSDVDITQGTFTIRS